MNNAKRDIIKIEVRTYKRHNYREYSDIYVNGVRFLKKHLETHAQTFLDGTVLGIRGIVTDRRYIRKQPQWLVFKSDQMQPVSFDNTENPRCLSYSSADVQDVCEIDGQLHLTTDTHAHMSCKKSPDANYKFEIKHTYITNGMHTR